MQHTVDLRKNQESQISSKEEEILKSKKEENAEQPEYISWQAPSKHHAVNKRYLMIVISVLLLGAVGVYIFKQDIIMAIFLILASIVIMLYSTKKPELKNIVIDISGVRIGEDGFIYKELQSFWIDYNPGFDKELSLESKRWYLPYVTISLENQNPIEVRSWLMNFLPEKEHEKSVIDILFKKIGL